MIQSALPKLLVLSLVIRSGRCDCQPTFHGTCEGSCAKGFCYASRIGACICYASPTPTPAPPTPTPAPPTTRYGCVQGLCVPSGNATLTKHDCESMCVPQRYTCRGGQCVAADNATLSKRDCESMCVQLYQCVAGVCEAATSGVSQAACKANCGSEKNPGLQGTTSTNAAGLPLFA